jgi:putative SOS response-associated peptidase YedK
MPGLCVAASPLLLSLDIRFHLNLDRDLPLYAPRFNIAPEQTSPAIPVIVRHADRNQCRLMHWGLDFPSGQRFDDRKPDDQKLLIAFLSCRFIALLIVR